MKRELVRTRLAAVAVVALAIAASSSGQGVPGTISPNERCDLLGTVCDLSTAGTTGNLCSVNGNGCTSIGCMALTCQWHRDWSCVPDPTDCCVLAEYIGFSTGNCIGPKRTAYAGTGGTIERCECECAVAGTSLTQWTSVACDPVAGC